ncbi:MAG: hypothetical protein ACR2M0_04865 [Chloroflexia bacterium]
MLLHFSSRYLQTRFVTLAWSLTRDLGRANCLYFVLMRPGVFSHELAHAMAAAVVGGRILSFNVLETTIVPGARGGQARLGHVIYSIPGRPGRLGTRLRDAFVGLAPLPFGILLIAGALAFSGVSWTGDLAQVLPPALLSWRFWLALFAVLEIADNMAPSSVDRRNLPVALAVLLVLAALVWGGAHLLAIPVPLGWWYAALQGALVLSAVLVVPIALNLLAGVALWLMALPFRR